VRGEPRLVQANEFVDVLVDCPDGQLLTGGGYAGSGGMIVAASMPHGPSSWLVTATSSSGTGEIVPFVICIDPTIPVQQPAQH
jgi:hypothetical protein